MSELNRDALVIYRGEAARVDSVDKKITITLASGGSKKVRDKDITLLHSGPVKSLAFQELSCDREETWMLLQGETLSLSELSDFLFGVTTPEALYNSWLILEEKLYFVGDIDEVTCNDEDSIKAIRDKEKLEKEREEAFSAAISRLKKGEWSTEDETSLREIEGIALEQRSSSRVLKALNIRESALDAHKFLVKIGYWDESRNPYPGRMAVTLKSAPKQDEFSIEPNPLDLTHLEAFAIDDEGSMDPDDAISLDGNNRLWVHITDIASLVKAGSLTDKEAASRGSNLYLPTQTVHMLPEIISNIQALGSGEYNNTLSFLIEFDDSGEIINREIHLARVAVSRLSYNEVEAECDSDRFRRFYEFAELLRDRRAENGSLSIELPEVKIRVDKKGEISIKPIHGINSRNVVSEFMLLAGESAALFCRDNSIPIPYATQQAPDAKGKPEDNLASMYVWRRKFKRGETKFSPGFHSGLGLELYTRATSPLRRYSDLVVNQQIRSFLTGEPIEDEESVLMRVSPSLEAMRKLGQCERKSNLHWKLVYLKRSSNKVYSATYVEKKDKDRAVFIIEDLALEAIIPVTDFPEYNEKLEVVLEQVDIFNQVAQFRLVCKTS